LLTRRAANAQQQLLSVPVANGGEKLPIFPFIKRKLSASCVHHRLQQRPRR